MTSEELDRFIHQLTETITAVQGWTYLAMRDLPAETTEKSHLEQLQHTMMLTVLGLQEQLRHLQERLTTSEAYASMQKEQITCLECGQDLYLLSHRHLATHGPPRPKSRVAVVRGNRVLTNLTENTFFRSRN